MTSVFSSKIWSNAARDGVRTERNTTGARSLTESDLSSWLIADLTGKTLRLVEKYVKNMDYKYRETSHEIVLQLKWIFCLTYIGGGKVRKRMTDRQLAIK